MVATILYPPLKDKNIAMDEQDKNNTDTAVAEIVDTYSASSAAGTVEMEAEAATPAVVTAAVAEIADNDPATPAEGTVEKKAEAAPPSVTKNKPDKTSENDGSIIGKHFLDYAEKVAPRPVCMPPNVECDLNVTGVYRIEEKEQTFKIVFDVTFTWFDPSIPFQSAEEEDDDKMEDIIDFTKHFVPNMDVCGKEQDAKFNLDPIELLDRHTGKCQRKGSFQGDINQSYNMRWFPFDVQYLCINLKMKPVHKGLCGEFQHPQIMNLTHDDDDQLLIKRPHWAALGMDKLTEWRVLRVQGQPTSTSDFGWTNGEEKRYDGFQVVLIVSREAQNAVLNLALLLFFNVLIAFTAYAVPFDEFPDRMSITLTQFLTAMAFKYTAQDKLPPVSYLTLMDGYILLGFTLMFIESVGFYAVSRSIPDQGVYTQRGVGPSEDDPTHNEIEGYLTLTDGSVPGAILAFGRGIGLVSGERTVFDEEDAQYIDDVLFAFVFLTWYALSFAFAGMWIRYEWIVKPRFSDPSSDLWIDFTSVEKMDDFAPNEIANSGQDFYRRLSEEKKGSWLKFIKYGRAPKVMHFDCRASEGSIHLFTFDGIVKREPMIHVEKLFRLGTLSKLVTQSFRNEPPGLDAIYNSPFVDPGSEAESDIKDAIRKMLHNVNPDVFVATLLKEPKLPAYLQNKTKTVERFFRRVNVKVEYVSNEEHGRYEALAVAYAHSRQLSETPGVVINVGERWMRVTMTRCLLVLLSLQSSSLFIGVLFSPLSVAGWLVSSNLFICVNWLFLLLLLQRNKKTFVVGIGYRGVRKQLQRLAERSVLPSLFFFVCYCYCCYFSPSSAHNMPSRSV
jgi:hypothetical protein